MLLEHDGKRPRIDDSVYVAPNATISGDVVIGPGSRVLFGAIVTAEGGPVRIGANCIIMENSVLRGTPRHPLTIGDNVLVGPHASLSGCTVRDFAFIATGAAIFNGAVIGERAEVRVGGVVQVVSMLPADSMVPIGWIAVGDPAEILPPDAHDRIWEIQEKLNFPKVVFGLERAAPGGTIMPELTARYSRALSKHSNDLIVNRD